MKTSLFFKVIVPVFAGIFGVIAGFQSLFFCLLPGSLLAIGFGMGNLKK